MPGGRLKAGRFDLTDGLAVLGFAAALYGVAQIYPPAAWILGGAGSLTFALLRARAERRSTESTSGSSEGAA
jgi:hypothetical protein